MLPTDPPLLPSDPEAFRRQVFLRAARLRRRRVVSVLTGSVAAATVILALVFGRFAPFADPAGSHPSAVVLPTSSTVAGTLPGSSSPSSTLAQPTTTTRGTQLPSTTLGTGPATTLPTTTEPPVTTAPTSTTLTTAPAGVASVPSGCGKPAAPATPAGSVMKRQLVGTWVQCTDSSIFGPDSGGAVELFAKGTWRQLSWTSSGWQPRTGSNDAGTWQLLPASAAVGTERIGTVRFVAVASAAVSAAAPKEWTVRVMLTDGPPKRALFVEGSLVCNYRLYVPASTAASA